MGRPRAFRNFLAALAAVLVPILIGAPEPGRGQTADRLEKLFEERRFFELAAALDTETGTNPELAFYRGITANVFNRPKESAAFLTSYLRDAGSSLPELRLREALGALADDYVKLFDYGRAAETRSRFLPLLERDLKPSDLAGFASVIDMYKALAGAPPQTIDIPGDTEIHLTAAGEIPAEIGGHAIPLLPDTGSALSMIIRSEAQRLGLSVLDVRVQVGTATGRNVTAQPCIVPELRFGGIVVRNAVFLAVQDEMLYFPEIKRRRNGLIGFPILAALKELTFTRRGEFLVASPPRLEGPPNFFLERTDPILTADYQGRQLQFFLDTGAIQTELFPPFYRKFTAEIMTRGLHVPEVIEGVGTQTRTEAYLLSGLSFKIAGREVIFEKKLPVLTRPTSQTSDVFDGAFSLDLLEGVKEITLDYERMRVALK